MTMTIFKIFYLLLCLKLSTGQRKYAGQIDDGYYRNEVGTQPQPPIEITNPNFYRPTPWVSHQSKIESHLSQADTSCVKNLMLKYAEEEAENACDNCFPSGNRWHGAVTYPKDVYSFFNKGTRKIDQDDPVPPMGRNPTYNQLPGGEQRIYNLDEIYRPRQGQGQPPINQLGKAAPVPHQPFYYLPGVKRPHPMERPYTPRSNY